MPAPTLYEEAEDYINNNNRKERYLLLLGAVRTACELIETLNRQQVKLVYSRGEKQKNKEELKETWKLPKKLLKIRQKAPQKTWVDLPDVIGLTVVVYYPDQIKFILDRVVQELGSKNISLEGEYDPKTEFGYHAVHANFYSNAVTAMHYGLRCEVQCKTMLHDAWATKMHDLTYKPLGYLEPRLELLMQAFGDTLERVERQSQAIRDMIQEKWNAESERRRLTHGTLLTNLKRQSTSEKASLIRAKIEREEDVVRQAPNGDHPTIASLCVEVAGFCNDNVSEGWILAALLASFRPKSDLVDFLAFHANAFLQYASHEKHRGEENAKRVLAVPLAYVAAGNLDLAVNVYARLLATPDIYGLSPGQALTCKHNYANALIERHYFDPDERRDGTPEALRSKVDELLKEAVGRPGSPELLEASTKDTQGFAKIVFASRPEHVQDVVAGIDLCNAARQAAKTHQAAENSVGEQYCDLHLRLGWRRLLELEAIKA